MDRIEELSKSVERMVWGQARQVWLTLPNHTKSWISMEDLVGDGMGYLSTSVIPNWDQSRGKLTTMVGTLVYHYLIDEYRTRYWVKKRNEKNLRSLDAHLEYLREQWGIRDGLSELGEVQNLQEEVIRRCFIVEAISGIYREGTPSLKREMTKWFLEISMPRRKTVKFHKATLEFRERARRLGLELEDCRYLFQSPDCLSELQKTIH